MTLKLAKATAESWCDQSGLCYDTVQVGNAIGLTLPTPTDANALARHLMATLKECHVAAKSNKVVASTTPVPKTIFESFKFSNSLGGKLTKVFVEDLGAQPQMGQQPPPKAEPGKAPVPQQPGQPGKAPAPQQPGQGLSGMASAHQPPAGLKALTKAMSELGLVERLKNNGIANGLSKDRQRIIFYVRTASQSPVDASGRLVPITSFDLATLGETQAMQDALDTLIDLANNNAPGTGRAKRESTRQLEQDLKQLAKVVTERPSPEGEDEKDADWKARISSIFKST